MPQGESFWNPYRLIPVRDHVERSAPYTHERFRGQSGIIECSLKNLTPLFVGAHSSGTNHPPLTRNGNRVIPGSSLKGMLRSLAEIVGGGCFVVSNQKDSEKIPKSPIPKGMEACSRVDKLCIACRMFGAMERNSNARVHKGKISIGDAIIQEDKPRVKSLQVLMANNGVRHEPFYRSQISRKLDGKSRKVYFHQPKCVDSLYPIDPNIRQRAWNIDAILPSHHFNFAIQFTNLSDQEFSLLLYILNLENNVKVVIGEEKIILEGPMRHKIGNAKPLGLGSCHIQLKRMTLFAPPSERFVSMTAKNKRVIEGDSLDEEIRKRILFFANDQCATMQALRKMLVWDETDKRNFHYPDFPWFEKQKKEPNPVTLKPI